MGFNKCNLHDHTSATVNMPSCLLYLATTSILLLTSTLPSLASDALTAEQIRSIAIEARVGNRDALSQLKHEAQQGDANAQFQLGNLYVSGKGVTQDYQEARRWYDQAANQGLADGQFALAQMSMKNLGGSLGPIEEARLLSMAAGRASPGRSLNLACPSTKG